jgi:hypothetical protein
VPAASVFLLVSGCSAGPQPAASPTATAPLAATGTPAPTAPSPAGSSRPACGAYSPAPFDGGDESAGVQFVSGSTGWAVLGADRILGTDDGGRHWVTEYRTTASADLSSVDFVDAAHGWVVGASEILATADGGRHWRTLPEPCPALSMVHFVSPAAGFAVAGAAQGSEAADGGVLLSTTDGGLRWQRLPAPTDVQSACFADPGSGWLGADGHIYGTRDGGRTWTLAVRGVAGPSGSPALAQVQCAGSGAWAELIGPGVASSQEPHIGYHASGTSWTPIFAEQYFGHPGVPVSAPSPGGDAGPFSAVSPAQAVFIDYCGPCGDGTAPLDLARDGGTVLQPRGSVRGDQ